jgi:hypothetical protein
MARHYSDELDRKKLWDRIASGLEVAASRNPRGGSRLVSDALSHVKASASLAASDEDVTEMMLELDGDESLGAALADRIGRSLYVVVAYGRQAWRQKKGEKNDA